MFSPYEPRYGDIVTFGITARIDSIVGRSNGRVTVILKTDAGRMYEAVYGADGEVESLRAYLDRQGRDFIPSSHSPNCVGPSDHRGPCKT